MPIQTVLTEGRVPVKAWVPESQLEPAAKVQLLNTARLPCVFKHVAAMPDVHAGHGATIGSVIPTKGAVIPSAVGVDIACGMSAALLPVSYDLLEPKRQTLLDALSAAIPVGHASHPHPLEAARSWPDWPRFSACHPQAQDSAGKALAQLGTLGGGNHFLELCLDTEQHVWVMLHSGSRYIGKHLAEVHIDCAKDLMRRYFIDLPDPELAYLVEETPEFHQYWHDLCWAQRYAFANRELLMDLTLKTLAKVLQHDPITPLLHINCHHNYIAKEHHFGQNVYVTRKGAVRARLGDLGIIPGSMGAKSFIVQGRGCADSFHSCSHGAGRLMSRAEARRRFTVQDLAAQTTGVTCRKDDAVLDEAPGAYKPIDDVMAHQSDLVEIVAELKQFLCLKGAK